MVIRRRKSRKDRQYNDQKEKEKKDKHYKVHINRLDVNLLITIQQRYHYESPIQYSKYVNAITDIAFCHFLLLIHMVI
jgi:hypothetical protein